jgi:hypothetical protein
VNTRAQRFPHLPTTLIFTAIARSPEDAMALQYVSNKDESVRMFKYD